MPYDMNPFAAGYGNQQQPQQSQQPQQQPLISSPTQGAAQMVQALMGGLQKYRDQQKGLATQGLTPQGGATGGVPGQPLDLSPPAPGMVPPTGIPQGGIPQAPDPTAALFGYGTGGGYTP